LGAASGYIYCLDSTTGTQLWKYKVGDWIRARPVRIAGVIYCATLDSKVVALRDNGSKAEELWRSTLGSHGITADLVGNDNGILASGRDLILYSLSLKTGKVQWRHGILDGTWIQDRFISAEVIGGGFQSSPTVVESVLYIGGPDGFINALDVETGKEIWRFETGGMVSATPIVADGSVFVGQSFGCGEFYRLDKDTGEPIWSSVEFGPVWVSAAYNDNRLFVGGKDGRMHCVDPLNGKILWTHDAGKSLPSSGSLFGIYSNTAADENNIYFGSWAGEYVALNQKSGSVIWKTKTCDDNRVDGKPDSAAPVLWKNHLYVQKLVESIVAINIHSGEIDWEWRVPEDRFQNGTAAAHENRIYFSASLGREILPYESSLYAFTDVENGGKYQWECKGAGGLTSPVLTDDKVVFGSTASVFLTCLDSENGSVIWRLYTGGVMEETTPALYGKLFFAQCRNGYLYAIQ
jgi:outer membrane protein assembly factor BamB